MRKLALAIVCSAPAALAAPASAQDYAASAINASAAGDLTVYGSAQGTVVDAPAVPGGKALRVSVAAKGANPWDAGVVSKITGPVSRGDELVYVVYLRLESGENGATSAELPANTVSTASPPYTALFGGPTTITPKWKMIRARWVADKDYAPGTLQAGLQLATGKQVVDVGPVYVSKVGTGGTPREPIKTTVVEDLSSKIVNDPSTPEVNGARAELLKDGARDGGTALRVTVRQKGKNNWDSSVESSIKKAVAKGDKLVLMFDARLHEGPGGATSAAIPNAALQQKEAPYKTLGNGSPALTSAWQSFRYEGVADRDYAADAVKATIQIGNARQTIDFANIIVLNMGQ